MPTLNQCFIMGHLGKDAEMKFTSNQKSVTTFSVATQDGYGENKKEPDWHNVVCWEKRAEVAAKLKKGQLVFVRGRVKYRSWENEQGDKRYATNIVADDLKILTWPEKNEEKPEARSDKSAPPLDDDLPF